MVDKKSNRSKVRPALLALAIFLFVALLVAPAAANSGVPDGDRPAFMAEVVSSAADQVTGGDARLHIEVPHTVPLHQVTVLVNGQDMTDHFSVIPETRTLTGVVDGLALGDNEVQVLPNGNGKGRPQPVTVTLTTFPITGPEFMPMRACQASKWAEFRRSM